jgi:hypothetical protein
MRSGRAAHSDLLRRRLRSPPTRMRTDTRQARARAGRAQSSRERGSEGIPTRLQRRALGAWSLECGAWSCHLEEVRRERVRSVPRTGCSHVLRVAHFSDALRASRPLARTARQPSSCENGGGTASCSPARVLPMAWGLCVRVRVRRFGRRGLLLGRVAARQARRCGSAGGVLRWTERERE